MFARVDPANWTFHKSFLLTAGKDRQVDDVRKYIRLHCGAGILGRKMKLYNLKQAADLMGINHKQRQLIRLIRVAIEMRLFAEDMLESQEVTNTGMLFLARKL